MLMFNVVYLFRIVDIIHKAKVSNATKLHYEHWAPIVICKNGARTIIIPTHFAVQTQLVGVGYLKMVHESG
jgi:hypothetical protein